jgi:hypothetical protein
LLYLNFVIRVIRVFAVSLEVSRQTNQPTRVSFSKWEGTEAVAEVTALAGVAELHHLAVASVTMMIAMLTPGLAETVVLLFLLDYSFVISPLMLGFYLSSFYFHFLHP